MTETALLRRASAPIKCSLIASLVAVGAAQSPSQSTSLEMREFSARSPSVGRNLFRELDPRSTGIVTRNDYADPRMWGDRYQEFALGGMGTGVAIADYDNDGWPDVFVVSKTESSRLFRNLGQWKFEDVTERAGLIGHGSARSGGGLFGGKAEPEAWKQGATFADVDNDGWLDLYVCRWGEPNWLFINQGDGTFREEAAERGLALIDASGVGAFADYDRDGWLDVYVQTNMLDAAVSPDGQPDHLFHNNGDGTFTDVSKSAGIGENNLAHSTSWWDYNQDGWPDIHVANDFALPDFLYRNNQDGTFTDVIHETVPTMPYSSMGADQGDINNDGRIDFLVADMATTTHEKDQRGMASSRELSREDSDSPTRAPQKLRNALYLNTVGDHLREVAIMAGVSATDWTWSVRFEDLDNDGRLDLHITNGMNREYQNADLRNRIILAENPQVRLRIMKESGRLDEANLAYRNDGNLQFTEVGAEWGLDKMGISFGTAMADLDRDGDLDLVHANYGEGVTVLMNQGRAGNAVQVGLRGTASNRFGVGARVEIETESGRQVRELVLCRGYLSGQEPGLHFGLGEDQRIKRLTVTWPSGMVNRFSDLPVNHFIMVTESRDQPQDLREPGSPPARAPFESVAEAWGLELPSREGPWRENTRQPLVPTRFDRMGPALAVGDLNGDGHEDMVMGGTSETPARIVAGTAQGKFVSVSLGQLTRNPVLNDGPVLILETNGDGHADVLVTRSSDALPAGDPAYQPRLLLNNGQGDLSPAPPGSLPEMPVSAGAVAAADFDRDGDLDVFVGARVKPGHYPEAPRSYLLANQGGRFADVAEVIAAGLAQIGLVTSALWSDVNGDGWIDLVVATEWGHVRAWRNVDGRSFVDQTDHWGFGSAGIGWWTSLAAGDFNGDGRMDYVAGNVGLNTPYQASAEEPAVLFYGDFRGRGARHIIEAHYEHGRLLPRRTGKAMGQVMPSLRRKFRRNDDFAAATLEDIVGAAPLAAAQRLVATEFRSGVFLSQPGGTLLFSALPREAQIAPLQGMAVNDFDGDGNLDLYALQNSFAPVAVVGRFDGGVGVMAYADSSGNFIVHDQPHPHLVIAGNAKAMVQLDFNDDGLLDLVGTRNDQGGFALANHAGEGTSSPRSMLVKLKGTEANPDGIGSWITLHFESGPSMVREVRAGSGYFSQSSARVGFSWPHGHRASADQEGHSHRDPIRLSVRWPDGQRTEHPVPAGVISHTIAR